MDNRDVIRLHTALADLLAAQRNARNYPRNKTVAATLAQATATAQTILVEVAQRVAAETT